MTKRHRIVRVPASSANLGPGYDSMATALSRAAPVMPCEPRIDDVERAVLGS